LTLRAVAQQKIVYCLSYQLGSRYPEPLAEPA
jgi:hypothetical protein